MAEISDEIRERAALILQVSASNGLSPYNSTLAMYKIGLRTDAEALACDAWVAAWVASVAQPLTLVESYAEAECLLRCGWCPGDVQTDREFVETAVAIASYYNEDPNV